MASLLLTAAEGPSTCEEGMDYRKEFRVDSDRVRLNKLDPAYKGKHASEAEAK
jgi:hypothetical protein